MPEIPKARVLALAHDQNLSQSFGALLHLVAVVECKGRPLVSSSENERLSWDGYWRGLISALFCVAVQEQQCTPVAGALLVRSLLDQAKAVLGTSGPEGEA